MLNQSCEPNADNFALAPCEDEGNRRTAVVVIQDIKEGEELSLRYFDENNLKPLSRKDRQRQLLFWLGGMCKCERREREK